MRFLPHVTDRQLLEKVTEWSIGAACNQAAQWREAALPELVVSVNVAAIRIHPALSDWVEQHLLSCGLPSGWLELDIAEHLLIGADDIRPVLAALRAAGVRLAVDDFGSAGASLTTLRDLPFDALKIAPTFARDIEAEGGADMVAAIIHLARALGLCVLAQGVESEPQLAQLRALGCDQFQGARLSEPVPAAAIPEFLQASLVLPPTASSRNSAPATLFTPKKRGQCR
jgi:EAL domain-containing protein (putative c-di-GMP-specific phosphodiesterase class I)